MLSISNVERKENTRSLEIYSRTSIIGAEPIMTRSDQCSRSTFGNVSIRKKCVLAKLNVCIFSQQTKPRFDKIDRQSALYVSRCLKRTPSKRHGGDR